MRMLSGVLLASVSLLVVTLVAIDMHARGKQKKYLQILKL